MYCTRKTKKQNAIHGMTADVDIPALVRPTVAPASFAARPAVASAAALSILYRLDSRPLVACGFVDSVYYIDFTPGGCIGSINLDYLSLPRLQLHRLIAASSSPAARPAVASTTRGVCCVGQVSATPTSTTHAVSTPCPPRLLRQLRLLVATSTPFTARDPLPR